MTTHTRNWYAPCPKPAGVVRLHAIGDSMTYGAGVDPDQTLPAHLTTQLNYLYPRHLIEIIPCGLNGGNMWHSWGRFKRSFSEHECDGTIFQLCNNDAQALASFKVSYPKFRRTWFDYPDLADLVNHTLDDIARFRHEKSVPIVIVFYSYKEADVEISNLLAESCAYRNLPFLSILDFLKSVSMSDRDDLAATVFDGHPSGHVHDRAARAIANFISDGALIPSLASSPSGDVGERCIECTRSMQTQGGAIEYPLVWAGQVLTAKRNYFRRASANQAELEPLLSVNNAITLVTRHLAEWHQTEAQAASVFRLMCSRTRFYSQASILSGTIKILGEGLAVLENAWSEETLRSLNARVPAPPDSVALPSSGWGSSLNSMHLEWRSLVNVKNRFLNFTDVGDKRLESLDARRNEIANRARPELQFLERLAREEMEPLIKETHAMAVGPRSSELWHNAPTLARWIEGLHHRLGNQCRMLRVLLEEATLKIPTPLRPLTYIDVFLITRDFNPSERYLDTLRLEVCYDIPRRWNVKSTHAIGVDRGSWCARFAIPLLFAGQVRLSFDNPNTTGQFGVQIKSVHIRCRGQSEHDGIKTARAKFELEEDAIDVVIDDLILGNNSDWAGRLSWSNVSLPNELATDSGRSRSRDRGTYHE